MSSLAALTAIRDAAIAAAEEQFRHGQAGHALALARAVSLAQSAFRGSQVRAALKVQAESLTLTGTSLSRVIDRTLCRKRGESVPTSTGSLDDSLMDASPGTCMYAAGGVSSIFIGVLQSVPACVACVYLCHFHTHTHAGTFFRMMDAQISFSPPLQPGMLPPLLSPLEPGTLPPPHFALSPASTPAFRAIGGGHVSTPSITATDLPSDLSGSVIAAICNLRDIRGGKANPAPLPGSQIETTMDMLAERGAIVIIVAVDNGLSTSALGGNSALAASIKRYRAAVDSGSLGHILYMVHGVASHEMAWGLFQIKASALPSSPLLSSPLLSSPYIHPRENAVCYSSACLNGAETHCAHLSPT